MVNMGIFPFLFPCEPVVFVEKVVHVSADNGGLARVNLTNDQDLVQPAGAAAAAAATCTAKRKINICSTTLMEMKSYLCRNPSMIGTNVS